MSHLDRMHNSIVYKVPLILLAAIFLFFFSIASMAKAETELKVGIREVKPFSFIDEKQQPSGYSIDLWNAIADELNIKYNFVPSEGISYTLQDMKDGKIDIAIGAITITEEREMTFDFSYSYFHTGLGILTQTNREYPIIGIFSSFFTEKWLVKIAGFILFLLLSAHLIWLVERRRDDSFHRNYFPGIFESIYWSIVTVSTVGYGDYFPKTKLGKLLSVLVIIISLPLFGIFVADFSSYITLDKLRSNINGPQDLDGKLVGVVKGGTSEEYLARKSFVIPKGYTSSEELFLHLAEGDLDAIVHDLPSLQYYANTEGKGKVKVVGKMFNKQDYAYIYPEGSRLIEQVNRALLKLTENGTITTLHRNWFGNPQGE